MTKLDEMFAAGQLKDIAERHSRAMAVIEEIWAAAGRRYSGTIEGSHAMKMLHQAKAFHCEADALATQFAGLPSPESGGR